MYTYIYMYMHMYLYVLYEIFILVYLHVSLGKKSDLWLAIDPVSGSILHTYTSSGDISSTCSVSDVSGSVLHIARTGTEYMLRSIVTV